MRTYVCIINYKGRWIILITQPNHMVSFFLIDNKSFYASVESVERGLNPLRSILVVMSEQENTNGGLVLATSPQAKKIIWDSQC